MLSIHWLLFAWAHTSVLRFLGLGLEGVEHFGRLNFLGWSHRVEICLLLCPCTLNDAHCWCWLVLFDDAYFNCFADCASFFRRRVLSVAGWVYWLVCFNCIARSICVPAGVSFVSIGAWFSASCNFDNAILFHDLLFFGLNGLIGLGWCHVVFVLRETAIVEVVSFWEATVSIFVRNASWTFNKAEVHFFFWFTWRHQHKFVIVLYLAYFKLNGFLVDCVCCWIKLLLIWVDKPRGGWRLVWNHIGLAVKRIYRSAWLGFLLPKGVEVGFSVVAYVSQVASKKVRVIELWASLGSFLLALEYLRGLNFSHKLRSCCAFYHWLHRPCSGGVTNFRFVLSDQTHYFGRTSLISAWVGSRIRPDTVGSRIDDLLFYNLNCLFLSIFWLDIDWLKIQTRNRLRLALREGGFRNYS